VSPRSAKLDSMQAGTSLSRQPLPRDAWLVHEAAFESRREADELLARLLEELAWEARSIELFGRRVVQPRLVAWAGDVAYRYSGQTLEPRPFTPAARKLCDRVCEHTGCSFNHVLFNRYRDGQDSMGMHSDDEPELGEAPTVASVSFGTARRFVIVSKRRGDHFRRELELGHGALLVMGGRFQQVYRHGVPKQPRIAEQRVSATFRRLLREPRVQG
jgi:alkylated DNA repair dioxygenase AlkB